MLQRGINTDVKEEVAEKECACGGEAQIARTYFRTQPQIGVDNRDYHHLSQNETPRRGELGIVSEW